MFSRYIFLISFKKWNIICLLKCRFWDYLHSCTAICSEPKQACRHNQHSGGKQKQASEIVGWFETRQRYGKNYSCVTHALVSGLSLPYALFLLAEDERFEADKSQVLREIAALEPRDLAWTKQLKSSFLPFLNLRKTFLKHHRSLLLLLLFFFFLGNQSLSYFLLHTQRDKILIRFVYLLVHSDEIKMALLWFTCTYRQGVQPFNFNNY